MPSDMAECCFWFRREVHRFTNHFQVWRCPQLALAQGSPIEGYELELECNVRRGRVDRPLIPATANALRARRKNWASHGLCGYLSPDYLWQRLARIGERGIGESDGVGAARERRRLGGPYKGVSPPTWPPDRKNICAR
jgi:hypothetical protein